MGNALTTTIIILFLCIFGAAQLRIGGSEMNKMKWLYKTWWKWLCAGLLLYALIGNFLVPLGPGVTGVSPMVIHPDSVYTIHITAYHSHFTDARAGKIQCWLKGGNNYYQAIKFRVTGNEDAEAQFGLSSRQQRQLSHAEMDLVLNDELDGTFTLRDAITLVKSSQADSTFKTVSAVVEPEVKNNKHRLFCFPYREILYETIRNTFFHVPMWFAMTMLVFTSLIGSIMYLSKGDERWDTLAHQGVIAAMLFGACGYCTGLVWAKYTWYIGVSWSDVLRKLLLEDIKMAAALIAMFFYIAYLILRGSISDKVKRARVSAMFNIFVFVIFVLCVFVLPRMADSMHPGNGGNPAFSKYDLDSTLRLFFYPAVIGWILLGYWILSVLMRLKFIQQNQK